MTVRTVLVTGANGFVGAHVARALVARRAHVRAFARSGADTRALDGVDCEIVRGDLRDIESVERAVHGCDEVYHVAADYRLWVVDEASMYAANVGGTRNLLAASKRAGVAKIVHTSTVGSLGIGADKIGREDTPVTLGDMVGPYKRSKFLAEQAALEAAREGLPVVIVNPSTPIGALDYKPTPTGRIIVEFLNRRMPAFMETGLNLVCVEDVARGHLLAAEHGRIGEKYILGGENLTLELMLQRLAAISGLPAPRVKIPYAVAFGFALGAEALARTVTHRAPRASVTEVRMARKKMFFDFTKARAELGYEARPIDDGLARAIEFFRRIGVVRTAA
ncbi:MAG: dihydroflavonol-4-reductase [Candidatus Binataceae bacterium]|jgi:dihydroflavonol-4-reductase|nr:dihydroflavonol-4-reductase [Candidatus Binataceae bacterium]